MKNISVIGIWNHVINFHPTCLSFKEVLLYNHLWIQITRYSRLIYISIHLSLKFLVKAVEAQSKTYFISESNTLPPLLPPIYAHWRIKSAEWDKGEERQATDLSQGTEVLSGSVHPGTIISDSCHNLRWYRWYLLTLYDILLQVLR